jgi:hypothetical protein
MMAWYDDLNKGFPLGGQQKPGSIEALRATMTAQQPQQAPKKKDFWTDQISTGGGIGGALGGAATGAAIGSVVPGIGTVIGGLAGGILGGALGSGGGEIVENKITGDDTWKNVGQEALLGGIFSAPPLRLAKGVIGAGKGITQGAAKQGFEQAFTGTTKNATRGALQRGSEGQLGEAWGIRPGVKSTGTLITPQKASELQSFASKTIGVPKTSSADMVFERAVNYQKQTGDAIASAVGAIPANSVNIPELSRRLSTKFGGLIGTGGADNAVAKDIIAKLGSAKTPKELWELRKEIDNTLISFGRNPQSAVPGAEQVARAARKEINDALTSASPAIKALNKDYSNTVDIINLTADAARTPKGFKIPGFQQTVGGATAQRMKASMGSGIGALPGGAPALAGSVKSSTGGLVPTTIRQGIGQNIMPEQPPALDEAIMQQGSNQYLGSELYQPQSEQVNQTSQSPYGIENLQYDIQRDPANADQYMAYYQQVQEIFGPTTQKPLSSAATKDVSNANVGLQALDQIEQQLGGDPSIQQRQGVSGTFNPFGLVSGALGTGEYENARAQARDVIARIRTGAALTADEARAFDKFLPQPGDDPATVQSKLSYLRNQFSAIASQQNSGSLEDALLQQQGAY